MKNDIMKIQVNWMIKVCIIVVSNNGKRIKDNLNEIEK